MKNEKSLALQAKAAKLIPGMTQLLSKRPDMYSRGVWPTYFKKAAGAEVIDLDDNHYLDFSIGGVGTTVLGYADPDVNAAVHKVIDDGSASTLNPPEEVSLAEKLLELHPWAERTRFARGGGEAMSIAIRIVRTLTGKDKIVFCGYHGWTDWYLAANLGRAEALDEQWIAGLPPNGVPKGLTGTALPFRYNDSESFDRAIFEAGDNLAAVVMEPIRNYQPNPEFMDHVHATTRIKKVPFIMDEISAGFRICNGGAHLSLGWQPDIAVFSKALGNGFPISAIIGKAWVMDAAQDAFITSTNWTERIGPVAALAMIKKFIKRNVSTHLIKISSQVESVWRELSARYQMNLQIGGFHPMIHFSFPAENNINRAFFTQEMLKQGFLASSGFYAMYAHTEQNVQAYMQAADIAFFKLKKFQQAGTVFSHLEGEPAKNGFSRIN